MFSKKNGQFSGTGIPFEFFVIVWDSSPTRVRLSEPQTILFYFLSEPQTIGSPESNGFVRKYLFRCFEQISIFQTKPGNELVFLKKREKAKWAPFRPIAGFGSRRCPLCFCSSHRSAFNMQGRPGGPPGQSTHKFH